MRAQKGNTFNGDRFRGRNATANNNKIDVAISCIGASCIGHATEVYSLVYFFV